MNAANVMRAYRENPVAWSRDVLRRELWEKQRQIVRAVMTHRRVVVASCHAMGKSYTAATVVLWFLFHHPKAIVITTAPTLRQVEGILWKEIRAAHRDAAFPLGGSVLTRKLEIAEDWYAFGFTSTEADRFQGFHAPFVLVVGDEAAGLTDDVFTGMDAVLSGGHARRLLIGNPTDPTSVFAGEFKLGGNVKKFKVSAFDTPNFTSFGITIEDIRSGEWEKKLAGRELPFPSLITPQWVREKWESWCGSSVDSEATSPLWLSRILAEFPEDSRDALIPASWLAKAAAREPPDLALDAENADRPRLGVDVARKGNDNTTVAEFFRGHTRILDVWSHKSTMESAGRVARIIDERNAEDTRVDVIGIGAGVYDRLQELGKPVTPVNVARAANNKIRFKNLRAELFWGLRERFDPVTGSASVDADDTELHAELTAIRYHILSGGQTIIEDKDDTKKRLGRSPDRADAAMLSAAPPELLQPEDDIGFVIA